MINDHSLLEILKKTITGEILKGRDSSQPSTFPCALTASVCEKRLGGVEMSAVRKLLSILLLAVLGLPMAAPLMALSRTDETSLPACCRRGGAHHCMGVATHAQQQNGSPQWAAPAERCPYCPAFVTGVHADQLALTVAEASYAGIVSHPTVHAQTESRQRIARDRSRQKRGPPQLSRS